MVQRQKTILAAALTLRRRLDRTEEPEGMMKSGGLWQPSRNEKRKCCAEMIRRYRHRPSHLIEHCCSATHAANLHGLLATKANLYHIRLLASFAKNFSTDVLRRVWPALEVAYQAHQRPVSPEEAQAIVEAAAQMETQS